MDIDSTFVWCTLMQVRDGELDVETATALLMGHLEQCVEDALEDAEHEHRVQALKSKLRRLEAHLHG